MKKAAKALWFCAAAFTLFSEDDLRAQLISAGPQEKTPELAKMDPLAKMQAIQRKLDTIIISKVDFDKLDITKVVEFLQIKSKEFDPDHEGINFILSINQDTPEPFPVIHREITIKLDEVSLGDLIFYVIKQSNFEFTIGANSVSIQPLNNNDKLRTGTFDVPLDFFRQKTREEMLMNDSMSPAFSLDDELSDLGFHIPHHGSALYNFRSHALVVQTTAEQLDLIADYIEKLKASNKQATFGAPDKPVFRAYKVPPDFLNLKILPSMLTDKSDGMGGIKLDVKRQLSDLGFHFPPDTTANFFPKHGILIVGNTAEQMDLIAKYIEKNWPLQPQPSVDASENLVPRTFDVPAGFLNIKISPEAMAQDSGTMTTLIIPVQKQLADLGFIFSPDATAVFLPRSGKLVVRNTPDELDRIADYIEKLNGGKPQPVDVAHPSVFPQTNPAPPTSQKMNP